MKCRKREASILEVSDKRFTFELGMRLLEGFSRRKTLIALRDFLRGTSETASRKILRKYSLTTRRNRGRKERNRHRSLREEMRGSIARKAGDKKYYSKFLPRFSPCRESASRATAMPGDLPFLFILSHGPFNSEMHRGFSIPAHLPFRVPCRVIFLPILPIAAIRIAAFINLRVSPPSAGGTPFPLMYVALRTHQSRESLYS